MEPGAASIGYAISILVLTPIAIAYLSSRARGQGFAREGSRKPGPSGWCPTSRVDRSVSLCSSPAHPRCRAVMAERAQRKYVAMQQALQDQRDFMQIQVNATARTGLYDEEMSDYEKRRGY